MVVGKRLEGPRNSSLYSIVKMRNVAILIFDQVETLDFTGPYEVFDKTCQICKDDEDLPPPPFNVFTVAESFAPIRSGTHLCIVPNYTFYDMPSLCYDRDILIIPGGIGSRTILSTKPHVLQWIQEQATYVEYVLSVCTGSLLLAKAGLLNHFDFVTTHSNSLSYLKQLLQESITNTTNGNGNDENDDGTNNKMTKIPKVVNNRRYIDASLPRQQQQPQGVEEEQEREQQGHQVAVGRADHHKTPHPKIVMSGGITAGIDMCLYMIQKLCGNAILSKVLLCMEYTWTPDEAAHDEYNDDNQTSTVSPTWFENATKLLEDK